MIGKLLDNNGEEVILEYIWDLTQLILTMDEFAEEKLNINGKYLEDYVYKVYVHDGANITRVVDDEEHIVDGKIVMGYHDSIYDAIDSVEKKAGMIGDVECVEYTYDEGNDSNVYTIKTENGFTLDIVEQHKWTLIWR